MYYIYTAYVSSLHVSFTHLQKNHDPPGILGSLISVGEILEIWELSRYLWTVKFEETL